VCGGKLLPPVGHATLEKVSQFDRVLFLKGRPNGTSPYHKRSAKAALDVDIEDEEATETNADILGGLDDGSILHDRG
jgi:hypothetical protein